MYTIKEAFDAGLIPIEFKDEFIENCKCGSPVYISDNRKHLYCLNENCIFELASRAEQCFNRMNIMGIGYEFLLDCIDYNKIKFIHEIFSIPYKSLNFNFSQEVLSKRKAEIDRALNNEYYFSEAIKFISIEGLDSVCDTLFKYINSYDEWEADIKNNGNMYYWVGNILNNYETKTINIEEKLLKHKDEIKEFTKLLKIKRRTIESEKKPVDIVITGKLYDYKHDDFIKYITSLGMYNFFECKAYNTASYVVCDIPSTSTSYREGLKRNILITSCELIKLVKRGEVKC